VLESSVVVEYFVGLAIRRLLTHCSRKDISRARKFDHVRTVNAITLHHRLDACL
jgi:hypothetical protein